MSLSTKSKINKKTSFTKGGSGKKTASSSSVDTPSIHVNGKNDSTETRSPSQILSGPQHTYDFDELENNVKK